MGLSQAILVTLFLHVLSADDLSKKDNIYSSSLNTLETNLNSETEIHLRSRRQVGTGTDNEYYVTQCGYDDTVKPAGPSISVLGRQLRYAESAAVASQLVHQMVRFMPRPLFEKIAELNKIGLYSSNKLPDDVFIEDFQDRPSACRGQCGDRFTGNGFIDCSSWCTTRDYPYQNTPYPANYMWAYGNFSILYVVETNVICQGFNPLTAESLLVREFGFMLMARIFDNQTLTEVEEAYAMAVSNGTWQQMKNQYEYFMMGTQAWFNTAKPTAQLKGMYCQNLYGNDGLPLCSDTFDQRQFIKYMDINLYKILNRVYNNNREYVNADTSVCPVV